MGEFTIAGKTYRTKKMSAFEQFHVARRVLPVIAKIPEMLGMTLADMLEDPDGIAERLKADISSIKLDVIAKTLSTLPDEDCEAVFNSCLDAVEIKNANDSGWAGVRRNGIIMYTHIGLQELIGFTTNVIKDNLSGFFSEKVSTSNRAATTPT